MYDRTGNYLIVAILIGLVAGVAVAAIFGDAVLPVKFLGDIFLNALKMLAIPLVLGSVILGVINLGDLGKLGRTGLKTIGYFLGTTSIAVIIGMILAELIQPGVGAVKSGVTGPQVISYSFLDWLASQIPSNVVSAAAETRFLPVIIFTVLFGSVLNAMGAKARPVVTVVEGVTEALMKMVRVVMWFAPIGIFGLVAGQFAAGGRDNFLGELSALSGFSIVVIVGLAIHAVIVLPLILKFLGGKGPLEYLNGMSQALLTAFGTASSAATLPVTMECVEQKNDIDKRASALVLPLGTTINLNGTALFAAAAAIFISQAQGWELTLWSQLVIFVTAVLASIGVAGIPQAGLMALALVLQATGMPMETIGLGLGMLLGVEWLLDRFRTVVNVWGNAVGAAVMATTAEIGLVDRRPRMPEKTQRVSRFKMPFRRDEFRKDRKTATPPPRGGDRGPGGPGPRRSEGQSAPQAMRRPIGQAKGSEGRPDPRFGGKDRRERGFKGSDQRDREFKGPDRRERDSKGPDQREREFKGPEPREREFKGPEQREMYRPSSEATSEKRPERGAHGRPGYGRKPYRDRSGKETPRETEKGIPQPSPESRLPVPEEAPLADVKPEFEIPRFPDRILEELAAPPRPDSQPVSELDDNGLKSEEPAEETDARPSYAEESTLEGIPRDRGAEQTPDEDDFARLDRMVMNRPDEKDSEPEAEIPEEPASLEFTAADAEKDEMEFVVRESEEPAVEKLDATDSAPESAADETVETKDESEDGAEPSVGETPASESGEDRDTAQWGRPKRKKMSR